ncbi:MAG: hypothetical protein V4581_16740 [Bacteroidota bacterium]
MGKLIITPGEKFTFNIEIQLSQAQLAFLCRYCGDEELESLESYKDMTTDKNYVVGINPSFHCGLGADINNLLSVGFMAEEKMQVQNGWMQPSLQPQDLAHHPFMIKIPVIREVIHDHIDCEVHAGFEPITFALNQDGEIINTEDIVAGTSLEPEP